MHRVGFYCFPCSAVLNFKFILFRWFLNNNQLPEILNLQEMLLEFKNVMNIETIEF